MKYSEDVQEKAYRYFLSRHKAVLVFSVLLGIASIVGFILLLVDKVSYFLFYVLSGVALLTSVLCFLYSFKQLKEASYLQED